MKKKILLALLFILIIIAAVGVYSWNQSRIIEKGQQADEAAVVSLVEGFGKALKKVSLLSPTAARDIEESYKDFLDTALLAQWKEEPSKAAGRLTSSPWPDRIEIISIRRLGSGAYDVSGNIVEVTSVEGAAAIRRPVELGVVKFSNRWLITGLSLGEYIDNDIAAQLSDCLPKSDMASREKCQELLERIRNFDECVLAGFSIMKSNPAQCQTPDGRTFIQETNSTWEMAVLAINNCEVEIAFQTHGRIVTLMLKNGNKLIATEPEIDDVMEIADSAAAECGQIVIGTE